MRGILRWIVALILLGIIVFLLINLFNRSKPNTNLNQNNNAPIVYEKSDHPLKELEADDSSVSEETIEVEDTASLSTICVFIGVFTMAFGTYYIYKKELK